MSKQIQVPAELLDTLICIAMDYINPDGPKYHGMPLTSQRDAMDAGAEAGSLLDASKLEDEEL